jgi:hypothetical protein
MRRISWPAIDSDRALQLAGISTLEPTGALFDLLIVPTAKAAEIAQRVRSAAVARDDVVDHHRGFGTTWDDTGVVIEGEASAAQVFPQWRTVERISRHFSQPYPRLEPL